MDALKAELVERARALGFDLVGVADARPFTEAGAYLRERTVAANPFEWPNLDERLDPERLLPGARSIVAVGMSYAMPEVPAPPPGALRGWLSRYCRGLDYHTLMDEGLDVLARWLEARLPGTRTYRHVDVAAPLDRAAAERAGLGRFGKSTMLIARGYGTWTFLGELYTTAALPPDPPAAWNACGSCTRCLDACPTGALSEWAIDSTRCLGYLNQGDGDLPLAYRAVMGDRLFGCDDCQTVCPYNRTALVSLHPEYAPLPAVGAYPELPRLLAMTEAEFEEAWGPGAAAWRGLATLKRNALVALGNSGAPEAWPHLASALDGSDPMLRRHAAWGLGRLAELAPELAAEITSFLRHRLEREPEASVRAEIEGALQQKVHHEAL